MRTNFVELGRLACSVEIPDQSPKDLFKPVKVLKLNVGSYIPHPFILSLLSTNSIHRIISNATKKSLVIGEKIYCVRDDDKEFTKVTVIDNVETLEEIESLLERNYTVYKNIKLNKDQSLFQEVFNKKDLGLLQALPPKPKLEEAIAEVVADVIEKEVRYQYKTSLKGFHFCDDVVIKRPPGKIENIFLERAFDGAETIRAENLITNYFYIYTEDIFNTVFEFVNESPWSLYSLEVQHNVVFVYRYADVRVFAYENQKLYQQAQEQE